MDAGAHTATAAWSAPSPGVYAVRLVVTDDDGGEGQATQVDGVEAMVVVYDPAGGFVTGGGWFQFPAGAYLPDTTLVGKASFGFVSKYQRGATVPTGETEFQFKAANLKFNSSVYEWLVVSGARAQYRGSGTVNGAAGYRFSLTAIDGELLSSGTPDLIRIRIWHDASGGLVYDNQRGASDGEDPVTVLGGGSIVIHRPPSSGGRGTESGSALPTPTAFAVHPPAPNPSRTGVAMIVDLPEESDVEATVVDVAGRQVERLHSGLLPAGRHELRWPAIDRTGRRVPPGLYLVRVTSARQGSPLRHAVRKLIVQ